MRATFDECLAITERKNHDYTQGGDNAFKNFELVEYLGVSETAEAIFMRMSDKFSRIATLLKRDGLVTDEKMEDTIKDLINYLAILRAYLGATKNRTPTDFVEKHNNEINWENEKS